jgi:hypothetical protein
MASRGLRVAARKRRVSPRRAAIRTGAASTARSPAAILGGRRKRSGSSAAVSEFPKVSGFEFHALLGRGGMASVYSARQLSLGRTVAIKVVEPAANDAERQLARLEAEARGLAGLHHPNIVDLYDFGRTEQGGMYYVMPLLPGGDLTRWPRPVPPVRVTALLEGLLDALAHAHACGIVHRDIKPENILFDRAGRPLLADFGVALMRHASRLTEQGKAIGSTGYMSPEQARGADVDARSDLYSLAVVAFELLTGRLPFEGSTPLAVALAQCEQPVPRLPPELAHWQALFDSALAVDPDQRPASAEEMRLALRLLQATPPSRHARTPTAARWRLVAGVAALALAFGAAWLWSTQRDPPGALRAAAQLIASGPWAPPDQPNAVDALLSAQAQPHDTARWARLRQQLLERLAADIEPALRRNDLVALLPHWHRWQAAVTALDARAQTVVAETEAGVAEAVRAPLERALAEFDRTPAGAALEIVDAWPSAPEAVAALARRVRALPNIGERFQDADGPELVLVARPGPDGPGMAVMSTALQPALYAAFAADRARATPSCSAEPAAVQRCLDLAGSRELAAWLSARTGQRYRLPTRDEASGLLSQVTPVANVLVWTSSCRELRELRQPGAARRTWTGVKRLFGAERPAPRFETTCAGYYALPLDGGAAQLLDGADERTSALLVREVTSAVGAGSVR